MLNFDYNPDSRELYLIADEAGRTHLHGLLEEQKTSQDKKVEVPLENNRIFTKLLIVEEVPKRDDVKPLPMWVPIACILGVLSLIFGILIFLMYMATT